jgi:hypothetical protein
MIDASDLTYAEVRLQYVLPLLDEILQKSGLSGIVTNIETLPLSSDPSSSSTLAGTLFDDITAGSRDCSFNAGSAYSVSSNRCYHEVGLHIVVMLILQKSLLTIRFVSTE